MTSVVLSQLAKQDLDDIWFHIVLEIVQRGLVHED